MPTIVIFDTQTGAVRSILPSRDQNEFAGRDDALIGPAIPDGVEHRWLKVDGGTLREWTQAEKDAQAAIEAEAQATAQADEIWREKLSGTWTCPKTGLTFETSIASRDTIAAQTTQLESGLRRGKIQNNTLIPVWPVGASEPVVMTVEAVLDLWWDFGTAWTAMYNEFCP